jgi:isochorismate synthase
MPEQLQPQLIDSLLAETSDSAAFAVFRRPGDKITLIWQETGLPRIFSEPEELDALWDGDRPIKSGFVLAPFQPGEGKPIIVIEAERQLDGSELSRFLADRRQKNSRPESPPPGGRELTGGSPAGSGGRSGYSRVFAIFSAALRQKEAGLTKLVLSRTLTRDLPAGLSGGALFLRACAGFPESFVYLCSTPDSGAWLGCTPEALLTGSGSNWQTVALAGTRAGPEGRWDEKNILEQRIVADYMRAQLAGAGHVCAARGPVTMRQGRLGHLRTDFYFTAAAGPGRLIRLLHPSPAVCGFPRPEALDFINRHEGYDRGYYSGFLGFISGPGPGGRPGRADIYVNLRCLRLNRNQATLYAGGGILPASTLESEWRETENKLGALLSLMGR